MAGSGPGVEVPQIQPGAQPAQWVEAINALHREVAVLKNEVSVLTFLRAAERERTRLLPQK